MERTSISLPSDLHERLRMLAAERGVSMVTIIREALDGKLAERGKKRAVQEAEKLRPMPRSLGMGASQYADTATTVATERVPPRSWR